MPDSKRDSNKYYFEMRCNMKKRIIKAMTISLSILA